MEVSVKGISINSSQIYNWGMPKQLRDLFGHVEPVWAMRRRGSSCVNLYCVHRHSGREEIVSINLWTQACEIGFTQKEAQQELEANLPRILEVLRAAEQKQELPLLSH